MKKLLVLCLLCAFFYCISAQNRVRRPPTRNGPPPSVLRRVQPAANTRSRAQQAVITQRIRDKRRGIRPPISQGRKRIRPSTVRNYQDSSLCIDDPEGVFVHQQECGMYWYCFEGELYDEWCPEETPIFDYIDFICAPAEWGECWPDIGGDGGGGEWDDSCPQDPSELAFIRGDGCDDYYVCLSGWPVQWWCGKSCLLR
jgi:hypothetical protein